MEEDYIEVSAKTLEDALTQALIKLETTSDMMEYEVVDKGSSGFLGLIGSKPVVIRARKKEVKKDVVEIAKEFTDDLFKAMGEDVKTTFSYDKEEKTLNVEFEGPEMGVLIGKRGQTLDSIQYLIGLVVNKNSKSYIRVRVDTENYRARRKATLENLAKNIAFKVKRTRHSVVLEPMNPYERRIIHSALQDDKYVETHSEGDEPYRKIVVTLKKEYRDRPARNGYGRNNGYRGRGGRGGYSRRRYDDRRRDYRSKDSYGDYEDTEKSEEYYAKPDVNEETAFTENEGTASTAPETAAEASTQNMAEESVSTPKDEPEDSGTSASEDEE